MDYSAFHHAGDHGSDEGDGESVVDVELERGFGIVVAVVRQDVEEGANKVQAFACHVRNSKDGANALGDELGCGFDCFVAVLDEDWDLARSRRFKNAG